jgi:hypothetical protein
LTSFARYDKIENAKSNIDSGRRPSSLTNPGFTTSERDISSLSRNPQGLKRGCSAVDYYVTWGDLIAFTALLTQVAIAVWAIANDINNKK